MSTEISLQDGVAEVLNLLYGQDLQYMPTQDRFHSIARTINRALRALSLEKEWSYYSDVAVIGTVTGGDRKVSLSRGIRMRQVNDDAVRVMNDRGLPVAWAYFLPRDALHKYIDRQGLWCSVTRNELTFSRPLSTAWDGFEIEAPIMCEPEMFDIPAISADTNDLIEPISADTLAQPIDFSYPDLVVHRAAYLYAQTDPTIQPRVQTLEAMSKDLMYQVIERDDRMTDSPFINDYQLGIENSPYSAGVHHHHPHSDETRR